MTVAEAPRRRAVSVASLPVLGWMALASMSPAAAQTPDPPSAGFHHVHLNVVDPDRSAAFYTGAFEKTRRTKVAGWDAVRSENIFLLFNKVEARAPAEWTTGIWHFGWNSVDVIADHRRLAAQGIPFFRVPPPSGHMWAPDGNDVEIAPGSPRSGGSALDAFNHVHLMSAAPLCAGEWYQEMLGLAHVASRPAEPVEDCNVPFGPRRDPGDQIHEPSVRLLMDDIVLFIYPDQTPERRPVTSRGHLLDHFAVTYPDVPAALARLEARGVTVLEGVHKFGDSDRRAAMIEGPDAVAIELVEP